MNELLQAQLEKYLLGALTTFLATFGGCLSTGCTMTLADKGEFGFKQSTEWGFYHTASKTEATAVSNLEVPAIVEWVTGDPDPVEVVEP